MSDHQVTGQCRRSIEFIFDVDDTERMIVSFFESYEMGFQCRIIVGESYNEKRDDYNIPAGCLPDFSMAEAAANNWLKFHRLTPTGVDDL